MLDVAVAYNRYRFLGNEFLTWLWFKIDTGSKNLFSDDQVSGELDIGNRMVLENRRQNRLETVRITGDQAGLEEALLALKKGAVVSEMNLVYQSNGLKWQFTLKGESLSISGLTLPETVSSPDGDQDDAALLEKVYLIETLTEMVLSLFDAFVRKRVSPKWDSALLPEIQKWVGSDPSKRT